MRSVISCLVCLSLVGLGYGAGAAPDRLGNIVITDNNQRGTKDCKGGNATIMGNNNQLTLKNCVKVTVQGNKNRASMTGSKKLQVQGNKNIVKAGLVKSISTMGNKNTVFYKFGPKKKKPAISNLGNGNKIQPIR